MKNSFDNQRDKEDRRSNNYIWNDRQDSETNTDSELDIEIEENSFNNNMCNNTYEYKMNNEK